MANSTWVHNIDPFLWQISGNIGVRWYGLAYVTGFICAYLIMAWFSRKKLSPMTEDQVSDMITYGILGVLLGGRIGYAVFYAPELLTDFRGAFPFWGVAAVWEGGMASHGGFLGVLIACLLFSRKYRLPFAHVGDMVILGSTVGIFSGRIANFINGELMGRVAPEGFPLAVKFPQDVQRWIGYFPEKLLKLEPVAMAMNVSPSDWQVWMNNIPAHRRRLSGFVERMIMEIQNGNEAVTNAIGPILEPRHPSQLYAACTEAVIPFLILLWVWKKARKPGLICSLYFMIYAVGRVFNEFFRLPDAHLSDLSQLPLGLSRGQFLSLFIFGIGLAFMVYTQRQDTEPMGGWENAANTSVDA